MDNGLVVVAISAASYLFGGWVGRSSRDAHVKQLEGQLADEKETTAAAGAEIDRLSREKKAAVQSLTNANQRVVVLERERNNALTEVKQLQAEHGATQERLRVAFQERDDFETRATVAAADLQVETDKHQKTKNELAALRVKSASDIDAYQDMVDTARNQLDDHRTAMRIARMNLTDALGDRKEQEAYLEL